MSPHSLFSRLALIAALGSVAPVASTASAQATPADFGTYMLCLNDPTSPTCFQLSLTTAARVNTSGTVTGTTGTLTLRNLQGTTVTSPDGVTYTAGTLPSVLTSVEFATPGCLPASPCTSQDYFGGGPPGGAQLRTSPASAVGMVGGTVADWYWQTERSINAGESFLRFLSPSTYRNPNTVYEGLGGCASGGGQLSGVFNQVATTGARTCDEQGLTGALAMTFDTDFIFDATYFWRFTIRFAQQSSPAQSMFSRYVCEMGAYPRGTPFASGPNCGGWAVTERSSPVTPVPEPQSAALVVAGIGALVVAAHRRRRV